MEDVYKERNKKCALKGFFKDWLGFSICVLYKILLECSKLNHIKIIKALLEMTP